MIKNSIKIGAMASVVFGMIIALGFPAHAMDDSLDIDERRIGASVSSMAVDDAIDPNNALDATTLQQPQYLTTSSLGYYLKAAASSASWTVYKALNFAQQHPKETMMGIILATHVTVAAAMNYTDVSCQCYCMRCSNSSCINNCGTATMVGLAPDITVCVDTCLRLVQYGCFSRCIP